MNNGLLRLLRASKLIYMRAWLMSIFALKSATEVISMMSNMTQVTGVLDAILGHD